MMAFAGKVFACVCMCLYVVSVDLSWHIAPFLLSAFRYLMRGNSFPVICDTFTYSSMHKQEPRPEWTGNDKHLLKGPFPSLSTRRKGFCGANAVLDGCCNCIFFSSLALSALFITLRIFHNLLRLT